MMEKYITDERTGLKYELVGDYYLVVGDDEPEGDQPIGIWGQRHLRHLKRRHKVIYADLLTSGKLPEYLADIDRQAEELFLRLAKQTADAEGITEKLKASNQMEWVRRMNSCRNRASEIVYHQVYIRQGPSYRENDTEGLFLIIVLSKIRIQRRWGKETASCPAQSRRSHIRRSARSLCQ